MEAAKGFCARALVVLGVMFAVAGIDYAVGLLETISIPWMIYGVGYVAIGWTFWHVAKEVPHRVWFTALVVVSYLGAIVSTSALFGKDFIDFISVCVVGATWFVLATRSWLQ